MGHMGSGSDTEASSWGITRLEARGSRVTRVSNIMSGRRSDVKMCHLSTCLCFVLLFTDVGHFKRIQRDNSENSYLLSSVVLHINHSSNTLKLMKANVFQEVDQGLTLLVVAVSLVSMM